MESNYRGKLFVLLLSVQGIVVGLLFFLWLTKAFSSNQFMDLIALIIPLFTAHLVPAFDYFGNKTEESEPDKDPPSIMKKLSFLIPILYMIYMVSILLRGGSSDDAFQTMKLFIGAGEMIFGLYIGLLVTKIFVHKS